MVKPIKPKEQKILQSAQQLLSENNAEAAKDILLKYKRNNKVSQHTHHLLGLSYAILGEFKSALLLVEPLTQSNSNNLEYLKLLGGIYHGLHQYSNAIHTFKRALKINANDFQTLSNLASSLKEDSQYESSEKYFKQSLQIQPNQPDALTNFGLLMQTNAKLDDAIELHQTALKYQPEHPNALYNLAYALNEKGEYQASLEIYDKVVKAMPQHVRALCDIAHIFGKLKQAQNALPYLQRAIQLSPNDEHAHLNLGITHRMLDQFDLAESSFNETIRINPNNNTAKYYLAIMKGDSSISSSPDEYVQELFDGYAETFDNQLIEQLQYKTPELIGEMAKKHLDISKKYKILDLGCGTGLAGIHLQDISEHMIGIDLSSKMLKKAEERNIYNELITTGIEQYFETHDFQPDIILSADVFVYIGDISTIFKQVSTTIEKNGLFVFSTEDSSETDTFMLRDSGRFAHNEKYIYSLARENDFELLDTQKTIIRYEADEPIHGQVYLLQK